VRVLVGTKGSTIKRHEPVTIRRNTGGDYRGCLVIEVPRSRPMYGKIEGIMKGMADDRVGWNGRV
jgi:hypothetical protein